MQISLEKISKDFLVDGNSLPILKDITFTAEPGQIVAVLGRSGSGKTTLLNLISQLDQPSAGNVNVSGKIGYVPQKDLLLPWRTVLNNILLPIEISKTISKSDISRANALLLHFGLKQFAKAYPNEISGGMRQKVSLVRMFMQDPEIVLFDEPFSAIDFDTRLKLVREVREQIRKENKIGVFVTHNLEEAIAIADRVILISGRPAKVIYDQEVKIEESLRDPLQIRKASGFQTNFDTLWKLLSQEA